jgi:hypothetical protein
MPTCLHPSSSFHIQTSGRTSICDRLWENPAKVARQNSEIKGRNKFVFIFLVKMPLWYILSIPKCKNIFRSALTLSVLSQFYKYHFFHLLKHGCIHMQLPPGRSKRCTVHEFSTMNRQDGHLQLYPRRSNLRSYAHGQLHLEQAKLAIAWIGGNKRSVCTLFRVNRTTNKHAMNKNRK